MIEVLKTEYDRVTEIIAPFTGIEFVDSALLSFASERGKRVHKHIEGILRGWSFEQEDPLISPYIRSFEAFWDGYKHNFEGGDSLIEKRLYSDQHMITGQPDLIVEKEDRILIVDWKTSSKFHKSWYLQGAAYRYMAELQYGEDHVDDVLFVKLNKNAKATLYKTSEHKENLNIFMDCLRLYRWFSMDKTRKNKET